jgi:hypothetical protein
LSAKQEAVALLLASGYTIAAAASESGASERVIKLWKANNPNFGKRITEIRAEMTSQALGRLVDAMSGAADTLDDLARNSDSEHVRLSAARAVLELGVKLRESVELESRIAALEANEPATGRRRYA